MIGTGIKKYAAEQGMKCAGGVAYGYVNGFYISLADGAGIKTLQICLTSGVYESEHNAECFAWLEQFMSDLNHKQYRLMPAAPYVITDSHMVVTFADNPGTLKRVKAFIDEVLPLIAAQGFEGGDTCYHCARPLGADCVLTLQDGLLTPVYGDCAAEIERAEIASADKREGSVLGGALGALIGTVLGAIPWALLFLVGYVTSLAGLLIGFLSDFGYRKLGGRNSKARFAVVIVMVLLGVMLGTVGGYALTFTRDYNDIGSAQIGMDYKDYMIYCAEFFILYDQETALGREYDRSIAEYDGDMSQIMTRDEYIAEYYDAEIDDIRAEMLDEIWRNLLLGVFFGLLGCIGMFIKLHNETKSSKLIKLPRL